MALVADIADLHDEARRWRHMLHEKPELLFDVEDTASFVADSLRAFGCDEVVTGLGRTGVVGVIRGSRGPGDVVGLRADMDALPIEEQTNLPYRSKIPGRMHACGHDGHTTMLLGAAKHLARTRNFSGSVAVIFQPAEEGGGGGREMVNEGMMERFGINTVFGMHNMPGIPVGSFAIRPGPIMAATAELEITIIGKGGHAAMPHTTIDPIIVASQIITALQTVTSRSTDPTDALVVSITKLNAGDSHNIIPERVSMLGTVRSLRQEVAAAAAERIQALCTGIASAYGAEAMVDYTPNYPVTFNDPAQTALAAEVAADVAGAGQVESNVAPIMAGEDFSYMLEERPGAMIFIGNGDSADLHSPYYDFNDDIIPYGVSYWVRLAERALGAG
ncbi:amidohydrolase [Nitratireductor aestuarii]|uniref:Amidohydrolase n=1 Tax=Nitratireductor aestuarii TaxID=1735103 RepID=A0A916RMT8_9HYPH|nr:M20 aminoacylase family protein [Nitratireductor aestuarii]GGA62262.1 amidohydrolase [Nitratireductor aestuarii]